MAIQQNSSETSPHHHTAKIKDKLNDLITHLREDVSKIEDPKAQALFETTAEVLKGLVNAYNDYEKHSEEAWK
ncbi:hypothetical protein [Nostoc sp.]|uniref:hypothetical protein n=1 Tax=Nostoc sp. TaxID=1180 RepID=UPI002FF6BDCF